MMVPGEIFVIAHPLAAVAAAQKQKHRFKSFRQAANTHA
jgi:hypothetical protein